MIFLLSICQVQGIAQSKVELIKKVKESVVWIHSFSMPYVLDKASYSTGTGYVVDNDGLIITNNHVVEGSNGLLIFTSQREEPYYANVIWNDTTLDMAVIKAFDCKIEALEFEDAEKISQGDEILVFGFPGAGYKSEMMKVTWGLISSETLDSTIQTTAAINSGNSGGPAINLEGKVVGTIFAKTVGLSIEGTGYLRNIKFSAEAVAKAKKELDKPISYAGTKKIEAYKKICDAAKLGWKAYQTEDLILKAGILEHSKECILAAMDIDPDYGEAYYFLAAYYFNDYLLNCLGSKDNEARTSKDYFIKAYENAERKKPSLEYNENYLNIFKKEISDKNIDCSAWREYIENTSLAEQNQQARLSDFISYIETGETPKLLKNVLGGTYSNSTDIKSNGTDENSKEEIKQNPGSTFLKIGEFNKYRPVRLSVVWPDKIDSYTKNIGLSIGNAGRPNSSRHFYFKNQFSFELLQDVESAVNNKNMLQLSYNLGLQAKIFKMARFNPKPYLTIGYNPALSQVKNGSVQKYQLYLTNGAYNMGVDLDIWVTNYLGLSLSYEYTSTLSNVVETLYDKDKSIYMKYSKLKVGLIF